MSVDGMPPLRFGLCYDFRNPPAWRRPYVDIYSEVFEQVAWAEQHGFDNVWLNEHHLCEDGYAPSVFPIAAAMAMRTRTIRIGSAVLDMPFHDPIRVAEDAASVDVISGGASSWGLESGTASRSLKVSASPCVSVAGVPRKGLRSCAACWKGRL